MRLDLPIHVGGTDARDAAEFLADAGVSGTYSFEGPEDVFIPLARAAGADIDLYSNIAVSFPRSPMHLAHTAWDLQRLSGGRFMLGLGSQIRPHVERRYGAAFDHPAARMADQVDAVKAIFAAWRDDTPLDHRGRFWKLDLLPPLLRPAPLDWAPPPILVAAVGPRMTEVALRHADGILLHPFTSDAFVAEQSMAGLHERTDDFIVVGGAIVALANDASDQAASDDAARGLVAFYGSTPAYRPVLESVGHGDIQPELRSLTRQGRWAEMAALVDDDVLSSIVIRGDAPAVAAGLRRRYGTSARRVAVTIPHAVDRRGVAVLAAAVTTPAA